MLNVLKDRGTELPPDERHTDKEAIAAGIHYSGRKLSQTPTALYQMALTRRRQAKHLKLGIRQTKSKATETEEGKKKLGFVWRDQPDEFIAYEFERAVEIVQGICEAAGLPPINLDDSGEDDSGAEADDGPADAADGA